MSRTLTYLLSCTISKLCMIIGQTFVSESGVSHYIALAGGDRVTPANIAINDISLKTRFCGLHFRCCKYWRIFNQFYVIRPERYRIRWNYTAVRATRFCGLHFRCCKYWRIFNQFYVIRPERYRIRWNYTAVRAISLLRRSRSFKVTDFGTNRKLIYDFILVITR